MKVWHNNGTDFCPAMRRCDCLLGGHAGILNSCLIVGPALHPRSCSPGQPARADVHQGRLCLQKRAAPSVGLWRLLHPLLWLGPGLLPAAGAATCGCLRSFRTFRAEPASSSCLFTFHPHARASCRPARCDLLRRWPTAATPSAWRRSPTAHPPPTGTRCWTTRCGLTPSPTHALVRAKAVGERGRMRAQAALGWLLCGWLRVGRAHPEECPCLHCCRRRDSGR